MKTHFVDGDWNAQCFECGFTFKASELRKHWQGYYVCERCWEPRHPQDFVRAVPDQQAVPWAQNPADTFVAMCTPNDRSAIPGHAIPECVMPNVIANSNSIF